MTNPYSGIITSEFKTAFTNAIDALLESTALTVACVVTEKGTKFTECPNCTYSSVTNKSNNKYNGTGPIPFTSGICVYCNGVGRIESVPTTTTVYLMPIWNYKDWINFAGMHDYFNPQTGRALQGYVQTLSKFSTYETLKKANELIIDTSITNSTQNRFVRVGGIQPIGLGTSSHIVCMWKNKE